MCEGQQIVPTSAQCLLESLGGKTPCLLSLAWGWTNMPNVIHAKLSSNRLSESLNKKTRFSQTRLYNEQAFRGLLFSELTRSERSGYSFNILFIYSTDKQGLMVRIDRDVVDTVVTALFRTLRKRDYIGWYRE